MLHTHSAPTRDERKLELLRTGPEMKKLRRTRSPERLSSRRRLGRFVTVISGPRATHPAPVNLALASEMLEKQTTMAMI